MKKYFIILLLFVHSIGSAANAITDEQKSVETKQNNEAKNEQIKEETDSKILEKISSIGFRKHSDLLPEYEIKNFFQSYEKYTNTKDINGFLKLHDRTYKSADGYDIERLKVLALESWDTYPNVKYSLKIIAMDIGLENATVITNERLTGYTLSSPDYIKGTGSIDSESVAIYYLQRFSNEWRIISDFIISEKTCMRFGAAKYIPMTLDAPSMSNPNSDYTATIKMNVPSNYLAIVSLNNEPITYPFEKSTEVFRGIKPDGIRERILKTNNLSKNENAVASIAIVSPDVNNDLVNISIAGVAFLTSRVNVFNHKFESSKVNIDSKLQMSESKTN